MQADATEGRGWGDLTRQAPGAMDRLGRSTFVTMEAWPVDPRKVRLLYVSKPLLEGLLGEALTEGQARAFVERHLLLALDRERGIPGAAPVTVYVDRQDDPMRMSLNGNQGSGRAAYVGRCFNLKGLGKTVLATSTDRMHSNGHLDLVSALWEMLCSNSLQTDLRTGTAPVLAVVDLDRPITVPWRTETFSGGLLIRLDDKGQLDRPTHLFQAKEPVTAARLRRIAQSLGRQDAEKFIERILHGCWSAGNTSLDGHLIDYDTVFAVRGRAPQWSYRPNWLSDFFGLEGPGQKKLLKALVDHPINVERVSFRALHREFDEARKSQLEMRFLDLVGIDPAETASVLPIPAGALSSLVLEFQGLAMKMYPNFKATAPWEEDNSGLSIYDLSRFLRFYPILRASGKVDEVTALALIRNPAGRFKETREPGIPDGVLKNLVKGQVVRSTEELAELDRRALQFIAEFDGLLEAVRQARPEATGERIRRAYVVNEEREYLNCRPGNDVLVALVQGLKSGRIGPERFSELMHLLIEANDRAPRPDPGGRCPADLRLFLDGFTANLVHGDGFYQPCLTLLRSPLTSSAGPESESTPGPTSTDRPAGTAIGPQPSAGSSLPAPGTWEVEVDGRRLPCTVETSPDRIRVTGPRLPLARLVGERPVPRFFRAGSPFNLHPISREDRPPSPENP